MKDFPSLTDLPAYVESVLAKAKAVPQTEYYKHIFETKICEAVGNWGFKDRFMFQQEMKGNQLKTYEQMKSKLKGVGAIVALVGERGLGKTTMVAQFAIEKAWQNYRNSMRETDSNVIEHVIYRKCARVISRYKPLYSDYGSVETETLEDSMRYLCQEQEFLCIDEVHDCEDQKMKMRVLTDLVDRRYACCRDTILIANQTPDDFKATIGDSILSRLGEHGAILSCKWDSFRTP